MKPTVCGVPQGSVLGLLLFILYINEIYAISTSLKIILFADDTNLLCYGSNLEQLLHELENELNNLKTWFDHNKLKLNLSKTKFIIFGKCTYSTNSKLTINNTELDRVSEIKFLGVIIHHKLSWIPDITYINYLYIVHDILCGRVGKTRIKHTPIQYTFCKKEQ